jgi:adenosylcobyric acid synthase
METRQRMYVREDLVEEHADTAALWRLIEQGPPEGLRLLPLGAP